MYIHTTIIIHVYIYIYTYIYIYIERDIHIIINMIVIMMIILVIITILGYNTTQYNMTINVTIVSITNVTYNLLLTANDDYQRAADRCGAPSEKLRRHTPLADPLAGPAHVWFPRRALWGDPNKISRSARRKGPGGGGFTLDPCG